jgi:NADP-dependent 3-hydroxy acid dehydrogenase YdfG
MYYRYEDFRDAFETNVFGPLKVTKAALPHMRARKTGTNVFISSISGWSGMEFNAGYAGTKFALEGEIPRNRITLCKASSTSYH